MWVTLKSMTCVNTTAEVTDEPYVVVIADGERVGLHGPYKMREGDTQVISRGYEFDRQAFIEVWESDRGTSSPLNDPLGSITVRPEPTGSFTANATRGHAHYALSYEVWRDEEPLRRWYLSLVRLECRDAQEGKDEVRVMVDDREIIRCDLRTGEARDFSDATLMVGERAKVQVWESDSVNSDLIGQPLWLEPADAPQGELLEHTFHADWTITGDATYVLFYRLRAEDA